MLEAGEEVRDTAMNRRRSRDKDEMVDEYSESHMTTTSRKRRLICIDETYRSINALEEFEKSRIELQIRNEKREIKGMEMDIIRFEFEKKVQSTNQRFER